MKKLGKELTATILASRWKVRVLHALYREDGKFYTPLKRVPGALFDHNGYIVFRTWESYLSSPYLTHGPRVNVFRARSRHAIRPAARTGPWGVKRTPARGAGVRLQAEPKVARTLRHRGQIYAEWSDGVVTSRQIPFACPA